MTAAALVQQVELGRVDLDAPVTDYIPNHRNTEGTERNTERRMNS